MERLTERVLGFTQLKACGNDFCKETCTEHDGEKSCDNCPIQKAFERLAEYEDLEEQGKLLKLPCAVGDTMYVIEKGGLISERKVYDVQYRGEKYEKGQRFFINISALAYFEMDFGKTVFLTREQAEAALKELEGCNE